MIGSNLAVVGTLYAGLCDTQTFQRMFGYYCCQCHDPFATVLAKHHEEFDSELQREGSADDAQSVHIHRVLASSRYTTTKLLQ